MENGKKIFITDTQLGVDVYRSYPEDGGQVATITTKVKSTQFTQEVDKQDNKPVDSTLNTYLPDQSHRNGHHSIHSNQGSSCQSSPSSP